MSPLVVHSKAKIELRPLAKPVYTFDTPIQQILASPHTNEVGTGKTGKLLSEFSRLFQDLPHKYIYELTGPVIGVRTMGSVSFMQVKVARHSDTVELAPLVTVQRSDIGDRQAIDMAMYPSNTAVGYVANEAGGIFRWRALESKTVM